MLESHGITNVRPLTPGDWHKLPLINTLAKRKGAVELDVHAIDCLRVIMQRLVEHRNAAWDSLAEEGWKSICKVFVPRNNGDGDSNVTVRAGYVRSFSEGRIAEGILWLGLRCADKPCLYIVGGLRPRDTYDSAYGWVKQFHKCTSERTHKLLQSPLAKALEDSRDQMASALKCLRDSL